MIRILVADDHAIVRVGLLHLFSLADDVRVVAQVSHGAELIERLRATPNDLVLLDLSMPGVGGIDLIERIRAHVPRQAILVLSMHNEAPMVRRALHAGANGYMSKDSEPEALLTAVRKVAAGGRHLDCRLSAGVLDLSHEQLSNRELSVFRLLVRGERMDRIADELSIKRGTVSAYKAQLMWKMGFQTNAELLRYGIENAVDAGLKENPTPKSAL